MKLDPRQYLYLAICLIVAGFGFIITGQQEESKVEQHETENATVTVINLNKQEEKKPIKTYLGFGLVGLGLILAVSNLKVREEKAVPKINLTKKEDEIVAAISRGLTNKEIAQEMHLSLSTIKSHTNNIYKKLGVNSRAALLEKLKN